MRRFLLLSLVLAGVATTTLQAATIAVTTDSGATGGPGCTLRDAVTAANTDAPSGGCPAGNGADVIELPPAALIELTEIDNTPEPVVGWCPNGLPVVNSEIRVSGNAARVGRSDPGEGPPFRIFHVGEAGNLTLSGLVVDGNSDPYRCQQYCDLGGLVYNQASLTLIDVMLTRSHIEGTAALYNSGALTMVASAITSAGGCSISHGGAIFNDPDGNLLLVDTTLSRNEGFYAGAALHNLGAATLIRCTISDNHAESSAQWLNGAAIVNPGDMSLINTTVSGNRGEAIFYGAFGATIWNEGTMRIAHSTISNNSSSHLEPRGSVVSSGTLALDNTIIANGPDCLNTGTVHDDGYNIVEGGGCISAATSMSGDPDLGPLADNGGPTLTHALLPESIAVDAGDCSGGSLDTDQRGAPRPQGSSCDIGAFELAPDAPGRVTELSVDKSGSELLLSWGSDCGMGDRYGVYRGDLALGYTSIAPEACDIVTNTATTGMGMVAGEFFLVVPAWNGQEGSYGLADEGQRTAPAIACHAQGSIGWCAQ